MKPFKQVCAGMFFKSWLLGVIELNNNILVYLSNNCKNSSKVVPLVTVILDNLQVFNRISNIVIRRGGSNEYLQSMFGAKIRSRGPTVLLTFT